MHDDPLGGVHRPQRASRPALRAPAPSRRGRALLLAAALLAGGVVVVALAAALRGERSGARELPRVAEGGFPCEVVLPGGARFTLAERPERVLPASATAVDLVSELVPPARVVAIPEQALRYSRLAEGGGGGFDAVPRFGRFEAESVLALAPDLVVVDPWADPSTVARLSELGVPVLPLPEVRRVDDVRAGVEALGRALGAEREAAALLADLDRRTAGLEEGFERRRGIRALSYSNSGTGGWTAGAGTTNEEVIRLAGVVNAAAEAGRAGHARIGLEELVLLDPDVIVVGDVRPEDEEGATRRYLANERRLAGLRAVREGRIAEIPVRLFSASSHEIVAAAEALAAELDRLLHEGRLP